MTVPTASRLDTLKVGAGVLGPPLAGGVVKRRPKVMGVLAKMQADTSAVHLMQDLRARYATPLLRLAVPGRSFALVLSADEVGRVLADSPDPFSPANPALEKLQPHGLLGGERARLRTFNENVLETPQPLHHLTPVVMAKIQEEVAALPMSGTLDWGQFAEVWWRIVRRIVLGDGARDDNTTTDLVGRLRLSWISPRHSGVRERALARLRGHLRRAEQGSLAEVIAQTPRTGDDDPASQVGHWLFAFDAAGTVSFRALAMLATHPHVRQFAIEEAPTAPDLPYLRASVLDTVRLWPTTPTILRDASKEVDSLPEGTGLLIFTPFFHRDDQNLPYAHSFVPDIWLDGRAQENPALVPFSAGPGECPARNFVLMVTSLLLAALVEKGDFLLTSGQRLGPVYTLPSTLDNLGLTFSVRPRR